MKLVIVESPAKCNTIERYLGSEYTVAASLGHIRDLATSGKGGLGVDVDNNFKPTYIINKDKRAVVRDLIAKKNAADEVILATDPDREGEAIAWHLANVLELPIESTKRLEFHEITRESISNAMQSPRTIDINLVSSQETRRILDRIIGFKLSNLLFRKIRSRSAGRVQSSTLKIIYDHEKEIEAFVSEEYWKIKLAIKIGEREFSLRILDKKGKEIEIKTKEDCDKILSQIPEELEVSSVETSYRTKESKEPFKTSTLQQEAFAKLKYKTRKTQSIAQQLYEGIEVEGEHVGLITYMRTDSSRLSSTFIQRASNYIIERFGKEFLGKQKISKKSFNSQDAHEAIRPTGCHRTPESVRPYLTPEQYNLYKLIYNRAISSMMVAKREEVLTIKLVSKDLNFDLDLARTVFPGYEVLYKDDDGGEYKGKFPSIKIGDKFSVSKKEGEQKFTEAPDHYSEAKIVRIMEEVGIGRPSTYASTIDTLRQRKYVENKAGILTLTEQGKKTAHVLEKYFPEIVDVKYTAMMEDDLDNIEDGKLSRMKMLTDFYFPFMEKLTDANIRMYKDEAEKTGDFCPLCGAPLVYKESQNGRFIGCSNYPTCKYVKKEKKEEIFVEGNCPICGKPLVQRQDKRGKKFIACSGFPKCKYIQPEIVTKSETNGEAKLCPECGSPLVKKKGKYGYFYGCSNFPSCNYMEKITFKKHK